MTDFKETKTQIVNTVKNLCTPAFIYLVISMFSLLAMLSENKSTISAYVVNIIYIAIWTWILNYMCSSGYTNIAWFILALPYIILLLSIPFIYKAIR